MSDISVLRVIAWPPRCVCWTVREERRRGREVRLIITNYSGECHQCGDTLSGLARPVSGHHAGWHCPDIRRGHYQDSDSIILLSCSQYQQYRGVGLKHNHFTLPLSLGEIIPGWSISQLFLSPLRSNSINCEKSEHLNTIQTIQGKY